MKILVTNDDGYTSKGLAALVRILKPFGDLTIVAPKKAQSGMSMAVTMGYMPIAVKHLHDLPGESWWYLDGTPASCIKFGVDNIFWPDRPDLVVSGINHGSNAATAAIYSGTIGAAMEGAVNGVPSIGVSLDTFRKDADFSTVEALFPALLRKLIEAFPDKFGSFFNVNFPYLPVSGIKGVKVTNMGMAHWEREYRDYAEFLKESGHEPTQYDLDYVKNAEEGEQIVVMAGDFTDNPGNRATADHLLLADGWITVTPHNIDNSDFAELDRLCDII